MNKIGELERDTEEMFKDHVAFWAGQGNVSILHWRKPDTLECGVTYIFNGEYLYITGDLGCAVIRVSPSLAGLKLFQNMRFGAFVDNVEAFSDDVRIFDKELAISVITDFYEHLSSDEENNDDEFHDLLASIEDCESVDQWMWGYVNCEFERFFMELDEDYHQWAYTVGSTPHPRLRAYLIGLQMAYKQSDFRSKLVSP